MTKVGTFFDINKSSTTKHIKFKRLSKQSSLKSTPRRFLNHSNNRYLEQKIYQKTTTNNLNSYRNLSQQIYLSHNYKLFKTFTLLPVPHLAPVLKLAESKAMNKDILYHEQNLKTASSRKHAYLHKKFILSSEPMSVSQLIYSVT